jgi:hypothetical protein
MVNHCRISDAGETGSQSHCRRIVFTGLWSMAAGGNNETRRLVRRLCSDQNGT